MRLKTSKARDDRGLERFVAPAADVPEFQSTRPAPSARAENVAEHDIATTRIVSTQSVPLQARLEVSEPGDPLEEEADRIADQVMRMPEPGRPIERLGAGPAGLHRSCAGVSEGEDPPDEKATIQRKAANRAATRAVPAAAVAATRTGGEPLDAATRAFMDPRFGFDFSRVRVHADGPAAEAAQSVHAQAYTLGSHVVFDAGRYAPGTAAGQRLLAHELAHVVQQNAAGRLQSFESVAIGREAPAKVWRRPKATVEEGELEVVSQDRPQQEEEWSRFQVFALGMDHAARLLAADKRTFSRSDNRKIVFVGLHPKFVKVYDGNGKSLGDKIPLKKAKGLVFEPGVYVLSAKGTMAALTISSDDTKLGLEPEGSIIGHRPTTVKRERRSHEEPENTGSTGEQPKQATSQMVDVIALTTEPERFRSTVTSVPDAVVVFFVPTYRGGGSGMGSRSPKPLYSSPIAGRGDGLAPNAPPWPVTVDGPTLVPVDSSPTFFAKVDWSANGNDTVASQAISQVGETIHYKWELFDITRYAKKELARDPASTGSDPADKPEKSLEERIDDFRKSQLGTGTDVTGMGGANREFKREFEDWWKDTKRAAKGSRAPGGDTVAERLSNAAANRLALALTPVSALTTAIGAALKWVVDLFAGPRQQQEIPFESKGIFLTRLITTPAINEHSEGKPIVRPPSVAVAVTEVTRMNRAVREALDEPDAQLAELKAHIALAIRNGNTWKARYLQTLLVAAEERFLGSPLALLRTTRDEKQRELDTFRKDFPNHSDFSRQHEIDMLDDQIALYQHHEAKRAEGATDLAPLRRISATLISEVTGEQYPLLLSAGPMAMAENKHQWMISDVTSREGGSYIGLGDTQSEALRSALTKFGNQASYGRGRIGIRTKGLGLERSAPREILVDSAPADWTLAEKRIDDLVTTLALLGLAVTSAGTASALVGAGVAAERLVARWRAGKLYLDAQTVSDALGLLSGLGTAGQLAAGLRVQRFETLFAIVQEGRATKAQLAAAAEALGTAQAVAKRVETANEALNYGGLLWGEVSFIDEMMAISNEERAGAITHAAARRRRATAISGAAQNNGLFIAGNAQKVREQPTTTGGSAPGHSDDATTRKEGVTAESARNPIEDYLARGGEIKRPPLDPKKVGGRRPKQVTRPREGDWREPLGEGLEEQSIQQGTRSYTGMAELDQHHVFPKEQKYRKWFEDRGVTKDQIHSICVSLDEATHGAIHGGGDWRLARRVWANEWNANMMRELMTEESQKGRLLTPREIWEVGYRQVRKYGLPTEFEKYRGPWD